MGCNQGRRDTSLGKNSLIILDFGGQTQDGTVLIDTGIYVSNAAIDALSVAFAQGYYNCSSGTPHLNLAIGTNNSYSNGSFWGNQWGSQGIETTNVVNSNGFGSQVSVVTANDMEPGFGDATATVQWMGAYDSRSGRTATYNYGSADGCPTSGGNGNCNNGWVVSNISYLSWGAGAAYAFPEIYYDVNGQQWANIGQVGGIAFTGTLSQLLSCIQKNKSCQYNTLGPDQSWASLSNYTGQIPPYSDDIAVADLTN